MRYILVGISLLLVYEPVGSITSILIGFFGFLFSSKLKKAEFWENKEEMRMA